MRREDSQPLLLFRLERLKILARHLTTFHLLQRILNLRTHTSRLLAVNHLVEKSGCALAHPAPY